MGNGITHFFLKAGQVHHHWSEHLDETIVGLYDASVGTSGMNVPS